MAFGFFSKNHKVELTPDYPSLGVTLHNGYSWYSLTLDDMKIDDDGYIYFENHRGERQYIQLRINDSHGFGIVSTRNQNCLKGIRNGDRDVMSHENAGTSISRLDDAINKVSGYRSNFGAQQNRLEHAMSVDDNTAENTQAAESRIRDADMAEEMVEYSKHSILEQAGQSMLAQVNQSKQGILLNGQ